MTELKELFKYINRRQFLIHICGLNPDSGLDHRFAGISTNSRDKKKGLTEADKASIKIGLKKLVGDIEKTIEIL